MKLRMPHTMILLLGAMVVALVATWLLPPGAYQTVPGPSGTPVIVPGTYAPLAERSYLPPWAIFTAIPRAMGEVQAIVFFILLVGGAFGVVRHTEAMEAGIGRSLGLFQGRRMAFMAVAMAVFAILSSSFGMASEYIPFVAVLVALSAAIGLDAMAAAAILLIGYGIGYGASTTNPFTVLIAQEIAGVPIGSGLWFRAVVLVAAYAICVHHLWGYIRRAEKDPAKALAPALEPVTEPAAAFPAMNAVRVRVLVVVGLTLVGLMAGIIFGHWHLPQLSALFVAMGIAAAIAARIPVDEACRAFLAGASRMTGTALMVGVARGIGLLLEDAKVLPTLVDATATPLAQLPAEAAAVGMMLIQALLHVAIPSGSGQALATMPIMAPIADIVGLSRQVSVFAFVFGDGFMNIINPTNAFLMAILGIAGVSYGDWLKLTGGLMLKLFALSAVAMVAAVQLGL